MDARVAAMGRGGRKDSALLPVRPSCTGANIVMLLGSLDSDRGEILTSHVR
jgi:hypothetical protein